MAAAMVVQQENMAERKANVSSRNEYELFRGCRESCRNGGNVVRKSIDIDSVVDDDDQIMIDGDINREPAAAAAHDKKNNNINNDNNQMMRSLFALIDKDEDGKIGIEDLKSFMHTTLGIDFDFCYHPKKKHNRPEIDDGFRSSTCNGEKIGPSAGVNAVDFDGFLKLYESIMREKTWNAAPADGLRHRRRRAINDGRIATGIDYCESDGDDHPLMGSINDNERKQSCSVTDDPEKICYTDEDLVAAFRVYDGNGDGVISAVELASVLCRLGLLQQNGNPDLREIITADDLKYCQSLIDRFDTNGDGVIDLDEFSALLFSSSSSI